MNQLIGKRYKKTFKAPITREKDQFWYVVVVINWTSLWVLVVLWTNGLLLCDSTN